MAKPKKIGGKMKATDIKNFLEASYQEAPPETLNGYILDKDLTTPTAKVYYNPNTRHAVVAHRGTQGASDWGNNAAYAVGAYELTPRYQQGKKTQDAAQHKYGKKNISTLGHSQGAILSRKLGSNTKEVINVNPAYTTEIPYKNEYNIRSSSDVVSGLYAPVSTARSWFSPKYSQKHDITIPTKSSIDVLGEHSYNILDRIGEKEIGVGAGIKCGGRRVKNLGYTADTIDWLGGAVGTPYINVGYNPIGVVGGKVKNPFRNINKAFNKVGSTLATGAEYVNPMMWALKDEGTSKAMAQSGEVTHDYLLPAVVSAGKPIYDTTAMTGSTILTGNPVLGKVAADTLWNEMVEKRDADPRQNQKSKELGELSAKIGQVSTKPYKKALGGARDEEPLTPQQVQQQRQMFVDIINNAAEEDGLIETASQFPQYRDYFENTYNTRLEDARGLEAETEFESDEENPVINQNALHQELTEQGRMADARSDAAQSLLHRVQRDQEKFERRADPYGTLQRYRIYLLQPSTDGFLQNLHQYYMMGQDLYHLPKTLRTYHQVLQNYVDNGNQITPALESRAREDAADIVRREIEQSFNEINNRLEGRGRVKKGGKISKKDTEKMKKIGEIESPEMVTEQQLFLEQLAEQAALRQQQEEEEAQQQFQFPGGDFVIAGLDDNDWNFINEFMGDEEIGDLTPDYIETPPNEGSGRKKKGKKGGAIDIIKMKEPKTVIPRYRRRRIILPQRPLTAEEIENNRLREIVPLGVARLEQGRPERPMRPITVEDIPELMAFQQPQGRGRKKKQIDFGKIKWGSFTRMFHEFKKENPKARVKDLEAFAKRIIKNKSKFSDKAFKKAQFYLNVIKKD